MGSVAVLCPAPLIAHHRDRSRVSPSGHHRRRTHRTSSPAPIYRRSPVDTAPSHGHRRRSRSRSPTPIHHRRSSRSSSPVPIHYRRSSRSPSPGAIPRRRDDRHRWSPYHRPGTAEVADDEDLKGLSFTDYRVSKRQKLRMNFKPDFMWRITPSPPRGEWVPPESPVEHKEGDQKKLTRKSHVSDVSSFESQSRSFTRKLRSRRKHTYSNEEGDSSESESDSSPTPKRRKAARRRRKRDCSSESESDSRRRKRDCSSDESDSSESESDSSPTPKRGKAARMRRKRDCSFDESDSSESESDSSPTPKRRKASSSDESDSSESESDSSPTPKRRKAARRRRKRESSSDESDSSESESPTPKRRKTTRHQRRRKRHQRCRKRESSSDESEEFDDLDPRLKHKKHKSSKRSKKKVLPLPSPSPVIETDVGLVEAKKPEIIDPEVLETQKKLVVENEPLVGPLPLPRTEGHISYGGALRPGEGDAIAQYVQQGKRIPRRGEVGLSADEIANFESLGFVMSGSRHGRMNAIRIRKENQVYSVEHRRALAMFNYEEKAKRDHKVTAGLQRLMQRHSGQDTGPVHDPFAAPKALDVADD